MKISIIGYSGSGKSTLASKLGVFYDVPVLYLDKVQFLPNWVDRDDEEAKKIIKDFLNNNQDGWVIDGNYIKRNLEERLSQSDKIIFLNFNRFICFYRALKRRIIYKGKSRESMTMGCDEKFDYSFMKWILIDGRTKQRKQSYENIKNTYKEKFIEIKNQKQLDEFVDSIIK